MQMLKGGIMILIITLSLLQTISSVDVIREDLFSFGIKKAAPSGPNSKHNSHHSLAHKPQMTSSVDVFRQDLFSFGIKRTVPAGPNAKHNSYHSLAHRHLIEAKGKIPRGSFNPIQKNAPHY
ncbi:unnamed protein product [Brassica rapa]|uniref:Uncharacterized protein n=1 Tax=Brassica campestris TaxID=3711 RepID=A0A3P5YKU7_BRACM|nr:unnamed protein product [Brassica rapa]VDC60648.1 unnamed protein product [Brassica rapa]